LRKFTHREVVARAEVINLLLDLRRVVNRDAVLLPHEPVA
jgi:hypothetical protein